jgi:hypothetical protein
MECGQYTFKSQFISVTQKKNVHQRRDYKEDLLYKKRKKNSWVELGFAFLKRKSN